MTKRPMQNAKCKMQTLPGSQSRGERPGGVHVVVASRAMSAFCISHFAFRRNSTNG
jgi:hypothetical protein